MQNLISDYLNFAKPNNRAEIKEFKASNTLNEIILLMQSFANIKGIALDSEIHKDLYIVADPFKFKQALLNLIKNAIEATDLEVLTFQPIFQKKIRRLSSKLLIQAQE